MSKCLCCGTELDDDELMCPQCKICQKPSSELKDGQLLRYFGIKEVSNGTEEV